MLPKTFALIGFLLIAQLPTVLAQSNSSQALGRCLNEYGEMKERFANCDSARTDLSKKLNESGTKLAEANGKLSACKTALQINFDYAQRHFNELQAAREVLRTTTGELNKEKQKSERIAAEFGDFKLQLNIKEQKQADVALNTIALSASSNKATAVTTPLFQKDGKIHQVTKLAIGVLTIIYDPKQRIKPNSKGTITAEFDPTPVIVPYATSAADGEENIKWFIRAQYEPQAMTAKYDMANSDNVGERRLLNLKGGKQIWTWRLSSPSDFQTDKAILYLYVSYQTADGSSSDEVKAADPTIQWEAESVPGTAATVISFMKDNLSYIIGIVGALITMWATIATVKNQRLQTQLDMLKVQAPTGAAPLQEQKA